MKASTSIFAVVTAIISISMLVPFNTIRYSAAENPTKVEEQKLFHKERSPYEMYTSYAFMQHGEEVAKLNSSTFGEAYLPEVIPRKTRERAADGKECLEYFVHHNYGDGFGHQLCDIAAAMVYHLLNRDRSCYLGILYDEGPHGQFGHGCHSCPRVYNTFNRQWPGIDQAIPNLPIKKLGSTSLWNGVLEAGGEEKFDHIPCRRCDEGRMKVGLLWVDIANKLATEWYTPSVDIALHVRKGDFPRDVSKTYASVIDTLFANAKIDVFMENPGEGNEILTQLNATHEIEIHAGGDAAESWLTMAKAKVLFLHQSSFSISASIASEGIIFSQHAKPYQGRYDNHYFPCKLPGGWFVSTGVHGNFSCDSEKIYEVSRLITEKYGER